jgi:HPr kinase/phosphorylase
MVTTFITVKELLEHGKEALELRLLSGKRGLYRKITNPGINKPGFLLSGFEEFFDSTRVQIIGQRETRYLSTLDRKARREAIARLFKYEVPAVVATRSAKLPAAFRRLSRETETPLLATALDSGAFANVFSEFISCRLAEVQFVHGTLLDVYGVGILLSGRSGIGKSEIALDLVNRGHILVADDIVKLQQYPKGILTGSSGTREWKLRHFIEVRGLGLIDIQALFGIQAVRDTKRVEVHIQLVDWSETLDYERVGLKDIHSTFAGVGIQHLRLPLNPGKNVGSIIETIAKTYHLKETGYNPPQAFQRILLSTLNSQRKEKKKPENQTS